MGSKLKNLSLVDLYNYPPINSVSKFAGVIQELDVADLLQKYKQLMKNAPHRHERGKQYFVGHEVFLGGKKKSNRKEEHLAGALFNECRNGKRFLLADKRKLKFIDYQFPLKARQEDKGIGKIDLFGVIDGETSCVIELKVDQDSGNMSDTPLRALLEGLAYCALVEANKNEIWKEAQEKFGFEFKGPRPHLMILAPVGYWSYYFNKSSARNWFDPLLQLIGNLEKFQLPLTTLISLEDSDFTYATGEHPARLTQKPAFLPVIPEV